MSQLKSEKNMELDLSIGLSWYAAIKIVKQNSPGRKVIYEIAQKNTPIKLTIGLDQESGLTVWLVDADNKQFTATPINKSLFLNKFIFFEFKLWPTSDNNTSLTKLILGINNVQLTETKVPASLGKNGIATYSLGSNLDGKESAVFDLAELMMYSRVLNASENLKLFWYAKSKYGV